MAFNLTIDIGNTATKLSLWLGDAIAGTTRIGTQNADDMLRFIGDKVIGGVILGAVAPVDAGFEAAAKSVANGKYIHLSPSTPVGIVNDYTTGSTLGADRLAAAVGALDYFESTPMLVADLGTAATFDRIDPDGHYCGGVISPGLRMRLDALHRFTAKLPLIGMDAIDAMHPTARHWGLTTAESISLGAINGVVAELIYYMDVYGPGTKAILTGGDSHLIAGFLPHDKAMLTTIDDDLVGRGLNRILRYNEK